MFGKEGKNVFKALILLYGQSTFMDKSILKKIIGARIEIRHNVFLWGKSYRQSLNEIVSDKVNLYLEHETIV